MTYWIIIYVIPLLAHNAVAQSPNNIRVLATDKDFVRLTWAKPTRFTSSIYGYTIKYRPVHSNTSWIVKQTNATQILLNELRPITKYEIILQAYLNASYTDSSGPSARIEVTTDETGNFLFTSNSASAGW